MKAIQGVLATWPVVYFVGFCFTLAAMPPLWLHEFFPILFALHGSTMVIILLTTLWFSLDAMRDERHDATQRLLWVLILMVGNVLALPIYYWSRIHPRDGWTEVA